MSRTPIGNVKGFSREMVSNMLYVIGLGYMGGSISAMGTHTKQLFPYDLNKLPYTGVPATGMGTSFLEYLFPMQSLGFPYTTWMRLKERNGVFYPYLAWLLDTCRHAFATTRYGYAVTSEMGELMATCLPGDLFRFYLMPLIMIRITHLLTLPILIMTVVVSAMTNKETGLVYTFAPITTFLYGLTTCNGKLGFGCIFYTILLCMFMTVCQIFITLPAYFLITASIVAYAYVVLFFSPFLYANGFMQTFHQIKQHKFGLTFLFMAFTLMSAGKYLTNEATLGLALGALYILYTLVKK